jgi:hypothetical protein
MVIATTSSDGISTWELVNPTTGTTNVVVNFSSNSGGYVSAVSYTNTNTVNPLGAMSINRGTTGNPSVSITTNNDYSAVDDNLFYDTSQSLTANSPQIQEVNGNCTNNFSHGASVLQTGIKGSNTLGWTHSGSNSDWIEVAVEVRSPSGNGPGQYAAKIDDGSFNSYTFATTSWTVYDKRGTKYTYGSDDLGRMYDTTNGTSTLTFRWMVQEVRDTNGNYIKYTYLRDTNVLYPYKITYTGNGSTDGPFTITFSTSTRPDIRLSYASGFAATTTKRISEIDASVNGSIVRKYLLGYGVGDNGYRSLLTTIQQQGYDDNNNLVSLPATTFSYATTSTQYYGPAIANIISQAYVVGDTDGDGINDVNLFMGGAGNGFMWHDNATSAIAVPDGSHAPPEYWATTPYPPGPPVERGVRYLDINGDSMADVVRGWQDLSTGQTDYAIYNNTYATSTGTYSGIIDKLYRFCSDLRTEDERGPHPHGRTFRRRKRRRSSRLRKALPGTFATTTFLGNDSAFDSTTTAFAAAKSFPTSAPTETASQLADINGDGLDDWVYSSGNNIYYMSCLTTEQGGIPLPIPSGPLPLQRSISLAEPITTVASDLWISMATGCPISFAHTKTTAAAQAK